MVADIAELEHFGRARRLDVKEVITPNNGEHFVFLSADGTEKLSITNRVFRKSTLMRDQSERGEERRDEENRTGLNH